MSCLPLNSRGFAIKATIISRYHHIFMGELAAYMLVLKLSTLSTL